MLVTDLSPCCRDGGLKRDKVKDTFKEEQQKLYSKMLVGTQEDRSRSWRTYGEVDWLRNPVGHLWLDRQSAGLSSCLTGALGLENSLSDVNSTPFGFLGHCLGLACSVCVAVTGHSESAALRRSGSTEALLVLDEGKVHTVKEPRLPRWQSFEGKLVLLLLSIMSFCLCLIVFNILIFFLPSCLSHMVFKLLTWFHQGFRGEIL